MWTAIYDDGKTLKQVERKKEHLFKDIDQSRLHSFVLEENNRKLIVNLKDGTFFIDGIKFSFLRHSDMQDMADYRLVYVRRVRKSIGDKPIDEIAYLIGYQFTFWPQDKTSGGINKKIIANLRPDGSIMFETKG